MTLIKKTAGIILSLIIALSAAAVPTAVFAAENEELTLKRFGGYTYEIKKEAGYDYDIKVSDNSGKSVAAEMHYNDLYNSVEIAALKKTGDTKPVVEVIKENRATGEKTTITSFKVTVKNYDKLNFGTVKISKGKNKKVLVKKCNVSSEYSWAKSLNSDVYTVKVKNKKIATFRNTDTDDVYKNTYFSFNGKKKGATTGTVYISGTKVKVGTIKIKVGTYKAKVDPLNRIYDAQYNMHGPADKYYIDADAKDFILNAKSGAKYSYKIANSKVAKLDNLGGGHYAITTKKVGTTAIKVYEKLKNQEKTKIGVMKLRVKNATMAQVFEYNATHSDVSNGEDIIDQFGSDIMYLSQGESGYDLADEIDKLVLNHSVKGTRFSADEYSITYRSTDTSVFTVDEKGIIKAVLTYDQFKTSGREKDENIVFEVDIAFKVSFCDGTGYDGIFRMGIE